MTQKTKGTLDRVNATKRGGERKSKRKASAVQAPTLPTEGPCQIPQWGGCCCTCRFHIPDMCHPWHDGRGISEQKGWICAPPLGDDPRPWMASNWPLHGMCEMQQNAAARTEGTERT